MPRVAQPIAEGVTYGGTQDLGTQAPYKYNNHGGSGDVPGTSATSSGTSNQRQLLKSSSSQAGIGTVRYVALGEHVQLLMTSLVRTEATSAFNRYLDEAITTDILARSYIILRFIG